MFRNVFEELGFPVWADPRLQLLEGLTRCVDCSDRIEDIT